jgi:hypothetical protein
MNQTFQKQQMKQNVALAAVMTERKQFRVSNMKAVWLSALVNQNSY